MARSLGKLWCAINNMPYPPDPGSNCSLNSCAGGGFDRVSLNNDFELTIDFSDKGYNAPFGGFSTDMVVTPTGKYCQPLIQNWNFIGYTDNDIIASYENNSADQSYNWQSTWVNNDAMGGNSTILHFGLTDGKTNTRLYEFYEGVFTEATAQFDSL